MTSYHDEHENELVSPSLTNDDSGLLPCPFCGSDRVGLQTDTRAAMSWVSCTACGLEAPTETGVSAEDAAAYWNYRVPTIERLSAIEQEREALRDALTALVNAKALAGVRELVAGWNGESKPDGPYDRHPPRLGATLPKTTCGAVYELDEAMQSAKTALNQSRT